MSDANIVLVYYGPRGSGKSLSMTADLVIGMVYGKNVWANYPIKFKYDDGKELKEYSSKPLEIDNLVKMDPEIKDGVIALDEFNLWCSNRSSGAIVNRMLNAWCQLIRKRNISVYITCQDFHTLDRQWRWQTDVVVECSDLHYRYKQLPRGKCIGQKLLDWSGYFTGHAIYARSASEIDIAWSNATRRILAKGDLFWNCYDSWTEFDILDAMSKYEIERTVKVISKDDLDKPFVIDKPDAGAVSDFKEALKLVYKPGTVITKQQLYESMRGMGYQGDDTNLEKTAWKIGIQPANGGYKVG